MSRGVVMETGAKFVVVLMPDGQFRKVRTSRKPQIGEEFNFTEQRRLQNPRKLYSASAGAAAILLLLFVPFLVNFWSNNHPIVAYMTMDVNPSIELGVTKDEKVVELRAINDDGADVTKGLEYKGLPLAEVTEAIMDRISAGPYLNSGEGDVIITSVLVGKGQAPDYELNVTSHMDEAVHKSLEKTEKGRSLQVAVTTLSAPVEVRDEAKNDGLSAGKMAFYLMAKKKGYDISLQQLKTESIHQAAKSMGGVAAVVSDDTPPKKTDAGKTTANAGDDKSTKDQQKPTGKDDKSGSSTPGSSSSATGADAKAIQEKLREAQKEQLKELLKKEQEKRLKHEEEKAAGRGKGKANDDNSGKGWSDSQGGGDWRDHDKKNEDKKEDGGKPSSSGAHSSSQDNDHRGGNGDNGNGNGKKQDQQHNGKQGGQEDAKNTSDGRPSGVEGHDSTPSGSGKNNGQNWNNGQVKTVSGSASSGGSKGSSKDGKQQSQTQGKTDDRDEKDSGKGKSDDKKNGSNGKDDKGNSQSSRDDNEDRTHSSGQGQQDNSREGRG